MTSRVRTLLVVALLITMPMAAATAGAQVAGEDGPSPYENKLSGEAATIEGWLSFDVSGDHALSHGYPQYYVYYENGSWQNLQTWVNSSDDRYLLSHDDESKRALVAAPSANVYGGWYTDDMDVASFSVPVPTKSSGLLQRSYVTAVDVNRYMDRLEPVALENESSYKKPKGWTWTMGSSKAKFTADGQAWESDANESTPADVRKVLGVNETSVTGSGVTYAVLDTGLNVNNTTNSRLFQNRIVAPYNAVKNTTGAEAIETSTVHGPWVTAAIAADPDPAVSGETYEGVAPDAKVIPIKALDDQGSGSVESIVRGINHAQENNADILSMSLGSQTYSPVIAAELQEFLRNGGTAVFVAAGNSKMNPATRYISSPADVDGIIAVGATNVSMPSGVNGSAAPAYFSEVGPDNGATDLSNGVTAGEGPDLAAPGMKITQPVYDQYGFRTNVTLSGTSMADPYAAAVGGLMLAANPALRNESEAFKGYMMNTSRRIPNGGYTEVGAGMPYAPNATTLDVNERTQNESRTALAEARDAANRAYSGSWAARQARSGSDWLGGLV